MQTFKGTSFAPNSVYSRLRRRFSADMHSRTDQGSAGRASTKACRGSGSRGCTTPGFPQTLASTLCMSSTVENTATEMYLHWTAAWCHRAMCPSRLHSLTAKRRCRFFWFGWEPKKVDLWLTLLRTGLVESTSYMVFSEMFWGKKKRKKEEIKRCLNTQIKQESYTSDL